MKILIVYWIGINAIAFAVTARDKRNARLRLRRVPEIDLLMLAAMGGAAAEFTPKLAIQPVTGIYAPGFIAYCAYLFIPSALHMKEAVQWHISRSRI